MGLKKPNKDDLSTWFKKVKQASQDATHWSKEKINANKDNIEIGKKTVHSIYGGASDFSKGLAGGFISDEKINSLQNDIENQGGNYRELKRASKEKYSRRDSFILGGEIYFLNSLPTHFSEEIENAYSMAYPVESKLSTLSEKVEELDSEQLSGLVSGIKGKLFELEYVDYLNDDNLPDGYSATLAESVTQTGWDIHIQGPEGETVQLLQAKATASIDYVKEALEKYPDVDVVTTEEVYSQLTLQGISERLIDSGISNNDLIETVTSEVTTDEISMDFMPPILTLAMIAFTSYRDKSLDAFQKANKAGTRVGKSYLAYILGSGVSVITNTWWLGLASSVASRCIADPGLRKLELYRELKKLKRNNQSVINKLKSLSAT